ncbi:MAG: hypothetical protein Q8O40_06925 [Chloroflexota bacterium]|nr:hypothetical protein [Chloroflexota bacterium]
MSRKWICLLSGGVGAAVVVVLTLALVACQGGTPASQAPDPTATTSSAAAQSSSAGPTAAPAAQEPEVAPPGGPSEGIKVHGEWTIEVREPDGALVSRTEFENALTYSGKTTLAWFLSRQWAVGQWFVRIEGSPLFPCLPASSSPSSSCYLAETTSGRTGSNVFKTLTLDTPTEGSDQYKMVMSGNFTDQVSTSISAVQTFVYACPPTVTPASNCESVPGAFDREFTWTVLSSPVAVSVGQQVLLTVKLSFS